MALISLRCGQISKGFKILGLEGMAERGHQCRPLGFFDGCGLNTLSKKLFNYLCLLPLPLLLCMCDHKLRVIIYD